MSAVHTLKTWPQFYAAVLDGSKTFEVRKDDRGIVVGDVLVLQEWSPDTAEYTGEMVSKRVMYKMTGTGVFGLTEGFCVLGLGGL